MVAQILLDRLTSHNNTSLTLPSTKPFQSKVKVHEEQKAKDV